MIFRDVIGSSGGRGPHATRILPLHLLPTRNRSGEDGAQGLLDQSQNTIRYLEGYLRFSYANSLESIEEALGRIGKFLSSR